MQGSNKRSIPAQTIAACAFALLLSSGACAGEFQTEQDFETSADLEEEQEQGSAGDVDNTYEHPPGPDIWDYLRRLAETGPDAFSARLHSCPKPSYTTLSTILTSYGVDIEAISDLSAGYLWRTGAATLGAAALEVRSRESRELTTSAAARLFGIFVQASPEIIVAMPTLLDCQIDGVGATMFNAEGQCTSEGVSCLLRSPATLGHIELCNELVSRASSPEIGQSLAVASLISAANTCH